MVEERQLPQREWERERDMKHNDKMKEQMDEPQPTKKEPEKKDKN